MDFKEQASEALKLIARDMQMVGLVDGIVDEPLGGADNEPLEMAHHLKTVILDALAELSTLDPQTRIEQRIDKFCSTGVVVE